MRVRRSSTSHHNAPRRCCTMYHGLLNSVISETKCVATPTCILIVHENTGRRNEAKLQTRNDSLPARMNCSLMHHREAIEAGEIHKYIPSPASKPVSEQAKEGDGEDDAFPPPTAPPGKSLFAENDQGDTRGGSTTVRRMSARVVRRISIQAYHMSKSAAAASKK